MAPEHRGSTKPDVRVFAYGTDRLPEPASAPWKLEGLVSNTSSAVGAAKSYAASNCTYWA